MNQYKQLLKKNNSELKNSIHQKVELVCDFLCKKSSISEQTKQQILSEKGASSQSSKLLEIVACRRERLFNALYEACKHNGLKAAADILRPDKAPHQISRTTGVLIASQIDQLLPDTWITDEHFKQVENGQLSVKEVTKESFPWMWKTYQTHDEKEKQIYPMVHKVRGNALIINIVDVPNFEPREGSKLDILGLKSVFSGLGFKVKASENLSKAEIDELIVAERKADHSEHDCFVFFIMSHGKEELVFDKNEIPMSTQSFIKRFNEVEDLKGKPKLFFFQSCRVTSTKSQVEGAGRISGTVEDDKELDTEGGKQTENMPTALSDVFEFRSSTKGSAAHHHYKMGSWFTQAVIKVFSDFAYCCPLSELSVKVNNLVSKAESAIGKERNACEFSFVPSRRQLYFFPGLYKQDNSRCNVSEECV